VPELFQEKIQAGIEVTRGTAVAATRILNGVWTPPNIDRPPVWSNVRNGSYVRRQKATYPRFMPTTNYSESATYEDMAWWLQMIAEGGVTGVTDGGSPAAYAYDFDPDLTTDTLKSFTAEVGVTGHVEDYAQVMVDTWQLRIAPDNANEPQWMLDVGLKMLGLPVAGTFASLTQRTTEEIRAAGTKIFIDDAVGDIGDTQQTSWLIDASLSGAINRSFKPFVENVTGAAPNKTGRGERTLDAQLTVEFDDYDEYDDFLSTEPVLRAVRLYQEGSIIHTTVRKSITIDIVGYWASWAASEREHNRTAVMQLQAGNIDATFGNDYTVSVVNALATLV
jgi:hypothetical protein